MKKSYKIGNLGDEKMGTAIWKCKKIPKYHGVFARGNSKLPYTTAVFNMTTALDCPSDKLGLCNACIGEKNYCYARKTERLFKKTSYAYRTKQMAFWANCTVSEFIAEFEKQLIGRRFKITHLRFNEAGDFRTQADVLKADKIAGILYDKYHIKTYLYTSRRDLDYRTVKNMQIMGSGFKKKGIDGEFKIIRRAEDRPDNYGICPGDCTNCRRCVIGLDTCVLLH